jgi:hypothetical protein
LENYHLLIVDSNSLNYHLKFGFIGTGRTDENFSIGLWKDIERVKIGDKIIFYVQNIKMFFGIFEVTSLPFFDSNCPPYLQNIGELNIQTNNGNSIHLKYRALIKGTEVFQNGIREFDLIDILPENTKDVLWSLIYRKLLGSRGCSPLFPSEYERIREKLLENNQILNGDSFEIFNKEIRVIEGEHYLGNTDRNFDNLERILSGKPSEFHLHSILLEKLPSNIFGNNIKWVGNEVYSGAAMQAIDLLSITQQDDYNIIEVKKDVIPNSFSYQIRKYVFWLKNRLQIESSNMIQPIIIGSVSSLRQKRKRKSEFIDFNSLNISKPLKYFEYELTHDKLVFKEIDMLSDNFETISSFNFE